MDREEKNGEGMAKERKSINLSIRIRCTHTQWKMMYQDIQSNIADDDKRKRFGCDRTFFRWRQSDSFFFWWTRAKGDDPNQRGRIQWRTWRSNSRLSDSKHFFLVTTGVEGRPENFHNACAFLTKSASRNRQLGISFFNDAFAKSSAALYARFLPLFSYGVHSSENIINQKRERLDSPPSTCPDLI